VNISFGAYHERIADDAGETVRVLARGTLVETSLG
jgi:hypothetical protein